MDFKGKNNLKLAAANLLEFTLSSNDSAAFPKKVTHTPSQTLTIHLKPQENQSRKKSQAFSSEVIAPWREIRSHTLYHLTIFTESKPSVILKTHLVSNPHWSLIAFTSAYIKMYFTCFTYPPISLRQLKESCWVTHFLITLSSSMWCFFFFFFFSYSPVTSSSRA